MLKQRVLTALALLAILLPALFWRGSVVPFALVVLVLLAAGAWEWGRLNGLGQGGSVATAAVCIALCAVAWAGGWVGWTLEGAWMAVGAAWVLIGGWLIHRGVDGWPAVPRPLRLVCGVAVLVAAWLAAVQAHVLGINFLLSVLVLVWAADIGAYFAGKGFGRRWIKRGLAPGISPKKSWEGAIGGLVLAVLIGLVWAAADLAFHAPVASLYSRLSAGGLVPLVLGVAFLATLSVVGDLVESLIKRAAGVKDSSGLLPGHGGVLDRVDALLPVLPLAMMLAGVTRVP